MNSEEKQTRLINLMAEHSLTASDVGGILARSESRVFGWRSTHEIPDHMLDLLEFKLQFITAKTA